jgi:hypothetical protein
MCLRHCRASGHFFRAWSWKKRRLLAFIVAFICFAAAARGEGLSRLVDAMESPGAFDELAGNLVAVDEGPGGTTVLRADAAFSASVEEIDQVPVRKVRGGEADALGVRVTLNDGSSFRAIINYEPQNVTVQIGKLKTTARFATDYR